MMLKKQFISSTELMDRSGNFHTLEGLQKLVSTFKVKKEAEGVIWGSYSYKAPEEDKSHEILDLYIEGNELFADIKILNTKQGKIIKENIKNDQKPIFFAYYGLSFNGYSEGIQGSQVFRGISWLL